MTESDEFSKGFAAGWLAASEALAKAIGGIRSAKAASPSLAMAGNLPAAMRRGPGRPRKSETPGSPAAAKRGPGRPRKSG